MGSKQSNSATTTPIITKSADSNSKSSSNKDGYIISGDLIDAQEAAIKEKVDISYEKGREDSIKSFDDALNKLAAQVSNIKLNIICIYLMLLFRYMMVSMRS